MLTVRYVCYWVLQDSTTGKEIAAGDWDAIVAAARLLTGRPVFCGNVPVIERYSFSM